MNIEVLSHTWAIYTMMEITLEIKITSKYRELPLAN